ncbi:hypothetical protein CERSUDRAFT_112144 [Gelatoporia subvermispora B]|uniref:CSC1/OSCA1-like 7TM region domain-containing protein n=1 Tax=Ceriporiopsis subvermispora (strain B) TaxID=914234 RepID=M2PT73_CERS8|nr:hypothetical protein CERSUDRAFT_112144 [Gelatoporia subvermispora B]
MATIQSRPFSKNYSGLINQSVIAVGIFVICISAHEIMKRKRRGKHREPGLGSVESWEFGYLYQGRSWARNPSPPHPRGWPLSWVKEVLTFPESRLNELRGVDATLYTRFLRGCFWFALIQSLTTLPVLFPIHVEFSDGSISPESMTRASITSLVSTDKGRSLLWIHMILLVWTTLCWMGILYWIIAGAFRLRAQTILAAANRAATQAQQEKDSQFYPHPHPQSPFHALLPLDDDKSSRGLRMRTIMVTNVPVSLRSEKELREYFEYYLSRSIARPALGLTSSVQPGFLNKTVSFLFNKAKRLPTYVQRVASRTAELPEPAPDRPSGESENDARDPPVIDRVVLVRRMTELASLLERREEVLRLLETAHIKMARKALGAVTEAMKDKPPEGLIRKSTTRMSIMKAYEKSPDVTGNELEQGGEDFCEGENRVQLLIRTLGPFVIGSRSDDPQQSKVNWMRKWSFCAPAEGEVEMASASKSPATSDPASGSRTVWDALISLPRSTLDAFQPLIHLSSLFRGKTVPSIDYYTAKLDVLTSLITEKRAKAVSDYEPMSTAFVTFAEPADARRACKYLAVHPENPLQCFVTMAPSFEDLDWIRLMKPTFRVEFVKDWVVNLGVWAFTIFWVFPVTIFVGLVSIQNISAFWPGLERYLDNHAWEEELLQSFVPTLLVALLSLLVPLILLLIAKKAHTFGTLSALHDRIMTRYYKFLIVNVLVFFCVGTAALQSFLVSFKSTSGEQVIEVIAQSFPSAGPFYVGWLIFNSAMHGGIELALFGLPLLLYPSTKRQVTPRKRALGIRPRTFNYYYWLPNHVLVIHVLLVFAVLNPLVIPFGLFYFCVEAAVIKNQLLHVYAKNYEGNGQILMIRILRYSLDGLILAQAVFLAYMVVLNKTANVAVSAVLIILTTFVKMFMTRFCRARFERDDVVEAEIVCGIANAPDDLIDDAGPIDSICMADGGRDTDAILPERHTKKMEVWPSWLSLKTSLAYATLPRRRRRTPRQPIPFKTSSEQPTNEAPQASTSATAFRRDDSAIPPPNTIDEIPRQQLCASPEGEEPPRLHVTRHPPHPAWDDESSPNHAYDNPYYTRPVDDVLWLPRDPLGILDLDDTVDVHVSLTSQPSAGSLGAWGHEEYLSSGFSVPFGASTTSFNDDFSFTSQLRYLDGHEEIDLPADIATRVNSVEKEPDVETTSTIRRRQTRLPRRKGSQLTVPTRLGGIRRPSTFDVGSATNFRSFSLGVTPPAGTSGSTSDLFTRSVTHRRNRSASVDCELGFQRDSHPRVGHLPRSSHSVVEGPTAASVRSAGTPGPSSVISTRAAVVGEVIVEEQEAAQERMLEEEAEIEKANEPRSWLTSWMFTKGQ